MKERIKQEIEKYKAINEKAINAFVPCWQEIDHNRGYIDGLRYALEVMEKYEADERLLNSGTSEAETTDAVSRESLVNELKCGYWNKDLQSAKDDPCVIDSMIDWCIRIVKSQPPVIPQRKKGKWIFNEKLGHQYCCSECGNPMPTVNDYYRAKLIGCPYCLTDMREEEKNERTTESKEI